MTSYILVEITNYIGIDNKPYQIHNYFSRIDFYAPNKQTEFYSGLPYTNIVKKFKSKQKAENFKNKNKLTKLNVMKIEVF